MSAPNVVPSFDPVGIGSQGGTQSNEMASRMWDGCRWVLSVCACSQRLPEQYWQILSLLMLLKFLLDDSVFASFHSPHAGAVVVVLPGPDHDCLWLQVGPGIVGYGSGGTLVFEGVLDGRRVAVKRILRQASISRWMSVTERNVYWEVLRFC